MIERLSILVFLIMAALPAVSSQRTFAQPGGSRDDTVPLVLVNGDTITTDDLRLELDMMEKMNPETEQTVFSEPGKILRRLIQNQLILQEGYRLEMEQASSVSNQVKELTRSKGIVALLDSVSLAVAPDAPDLAEARMKAVGSYIDGLMKTYNVSVDSTLLRSLDYGSADPDVQKYLNESTDVLANIPTGELTVSRFSRILRFKEFHGLVGKPDAAERRDKILSKWIAEALLGYQARIQGRDRSPEIQETARNLERVLIRQETLAVLLKSSYEPDSGEIKSFYEENMASFMSPMRVKMKSKKLNTEEAARAFRKKLIEGASIEWLAENDPALVPGSDPFPYDWFLPEKLGLKSEDLKIGSIPEPYGVPGGWVVAVVSELEEPVPIPLEECRAKIIPKLKSIDRQKVMTDIMAKLEDASEIQILPGAEDIIQGILEEKN